MNRVTHLCGGMMAGQMQGKQAELCAPLAQLKREHEALRRMMDGFARDAADIGRSAEIEDWGPHLAALKEKVDAFVRELETHSEREEAHLFQLMEKYIGRQVGPIAVMEYEHEMAHEHLRKFRHAAEQAEAPVSAGQAQEMASYALQAHAVLTEHFMKEENVLFPMAEQMLNADEKEHLSRAFGLLRRINRRGCGDTQQ